MDYFAVFGFPISHSLSPVIHQAFAKQFEILLRYERLETPAGELNKALLHFRQQGGKGANITLPLKREAYTLCEYHFTNAAQTGVVNTLGWDENGILWGDNTDGEGLIRDLVDNEGIILEGKTLLLLGAGGAAQGILPSLATRCAQIVIVNRTLEKALALSQFFSNITPITYQGLNKEILPPFDIVINATASSLDQQLPPIAEYWIKSTLAIDLAYHLHHETSFEIWAKAHGAKRTYNGIGMLVEQAALAFERWHQRKPLTQEIIQSLRTRL